MIRKTDRSPVVCEFFVWRLFQRRGVYYADGRNGKNNLGKHSLSTRDLTKAHQKLLHLDRHFAECRGLVPAASIPAPSALPVGDGWKRYLEFCKRPEVLGGAGPSTWKRYRPVAAKHQAFCSRRGIMSWTAVTTASVQEYGSWLTKCGNQRSKKSCASRTVYFELTLIKSVVRWLIEERLLPESCRLRLPLRKPQGTDTHCYSKAEVAAIVQFCRDRPDLQWMASIVLALACTGLRISELGSLRWSDIDLQAGMIRLTDNRASVRRQQFGTPRRIKGRRDRALPIHTELRDILTSIKRHADGRLFHGPRGGALKPDTVRNILVREVIEPLKERFPAPPGEIGFADGRLHSFRHFFCTSAFLGGASEADLKDWLGHRESKMVGHYRHLGDDDSRRKMQQIDFLGRNDHTV